MSALDAMFGAALLAASGEPATYTPPGGSPIATRAYVAWQTSHGPENYASQIAEPKLIAYLPASKGIAKAGGTIAIGALTYDIDDIHEQDAATISYVVRLP